ncbi:MAG: hypothetical protein NUW37_09190 [Planctomycetes bacterium]|nr:hypothetical protein [Planctomycetota bacterium]
MGRQDIVENRLKKVERDDHAGGVLEERDSGVLTLRAFPIGSRFTSDAMIALARLCRALKDTRLFFSRTGAVELVHVFPHEIERAAGTLENAGFCFDPVAPIPAERLIFADGGGIKLRLPRGVLKSDDIKLLESIAVEFRPRWFYVTESQCLVISGIPQQRVTSLCEFIDFTDLSIETQSPSLRPVNTCPGKESCPSCGIDSTTLARMLDALFADRLLERPMVISILSCRRECFHIEGSDVLIWGEGAGYDGEYVVALAKTGFDDSTVIARFPLGREQTMFSFLTGVIEDYQHARDPDEFVRQMRVSSQTRYQPFLATEPTPSTDHCS